jgi:hypothetical protein
VPNDSMSMETIRTFFETAEDKPLFTKCPHLPDLAHLHEFDAESAQHIHAHMIGHILDYRAGQDLATPTNEGFQGIPPDDLNEELRHVYNDCNNAVLHKARRLNPDAQPTDDPKFQGFGPEQRGCYGADARAELRAEAFRAYMQDPNYIKTVAPKVAARIRAAVNGNPNINRVIQFN